MNKRSFYGLFILVLLCFSAGISYACNLPPDAYIDDCPKYTAVDFPTYFNGYSSDPDGYIVDWRWTFPPQAYDFNDHVEPWKKTCKFSPPGVYCVSLEVEDNQGATDTFECTVYALKVSISGNVHIYLSTQTTTMKIASRTDMSLKPLMMKMTSSRLHFQ